VTERGSQKTPKFYQDEMVKALKIARDVNLGNTMRTLAMPKTAQPWSLTSLHEEADPDRREGGQPPPLVTFQIAEIAAPQQMFAEIPIGQDPVIDHPPSITAPKIASHELVLLSANTTTPMPSGLTTLRAAHPGRGRCPQRAVSDRSRMRQAATGEAGVGAGRSAPFSVSVPSTASFDRLLPVPSAICRCAPVRSSILPQNRPQFGKCRFSPRSSCGPAAHASSMIR
jgi:hypothetical protein